VAIIERLQGLLETFQKASHGEPTWPPAAVKERWGKVETYRRYFDNDYAAMLQHAPEFNKSPEAERDFTPVAVAREVCRFSADLMFSEEPRVTYEANASLFEKIQEANGLYARLISMAEAVAIEGRGGLRVIRDDEVSEVPLITHVHEDQIIWDERHGAFVLGGAVVVTRVADAANTEVYRLIEEHTKGGVTRKLYRGKAHLLGREVDLNTLDEFKDVEPETDTGLDVPTLIRWDNVSGGRSDIEGQLPILDRINDEYSRGVEKSRKSRPVSFADSSLFDDAGRVDLSGIVPINRGNLARTMGDEPAKMAETVQPSFNSEEVIAWIDFLVDSALLHMGYSKASYGRDQGGSADSGKALRLRQARTLLKKAGKDRMAIEALKNAYAVALAWEAGASAVRDFRPEIELGDGLPRDTIEEAQETVMWESAEAISLEERVRMRRPDWDEEMVAAEVSRIEGARAAAAPGMPNIGGLSLDGLGERG
jgi:hypothetical protein